MPVTRIDSTRSTGSSYNSGKLQDIERIIDEDDQYFEETGINRLTRTLPSSPFVEDDPDDRVEPDVYEAYLRREEIRKKREKEEEKKENQRLVEEANANPKGAIDFMELDELDEL